MLLERYSYLFPFLSIYTYTTCRNFFQSKLSRSQISERASTGDLLRGTPFGKKVGINTLFARAVLAAAKRREIRAQDQDDDKEEELTSFQGLCLSAWREREREREKQFA